MTLDTGDTTFWDALQRLCKVADLVEDSSISGPFDGKRGFSTTEWQRIVSAAPGIHLKRGKAVHVPTCVAGSVRIRLVKAVPVGPDVELVLEVSGEPRFCGLASGGPVEVV